MFRSKPVLPFSLLIIFLTTVEPKCPKTCDLALASYNVWPGATLTFISEVFDETINEILRYNPQITNEDYILAGFRINVPFTCGCIGGEFLGHVFLYTILYGDDTYDVIAETYYANLTTAAWLEEFNVYRPGQIPANAVVNVTVNCSCGDAAVSRAYGLFLTYPLGVGDSLESIAAAENINEAILQMYNPGVDFSAGSGLVYIPGRDESGNYPPLALKSGTGLSDGATPGIAIGVAMGALLVALCIKWRFYRNNILVFRILKRVFFKIKDGDVNANTGGGVSIGDMNMEGGIDLGSSNNGDVSIGNITINFVNTNTGGGGSIGNTNIEGG